MGQGSCVFDSMPWFKGDVLDSTGFRSGAGFESIRTCHRHRGRGGGYCGNRRTQACLEFACASLCTDGCVELVWVYTHVQMFVQTVIVRIYQKNSAYSIGA